MSTLSAATVLVAVQAMFSELVSGVLAVVVSQTRSDNETITQLLRFSGNVNIISLESFGADYQPYLKDFGPVRWSTCLRCFDYLDEQLAIGKAASIQRKCVVIVDVSEALHSTRQRSMNILTLLYLYLIDRFGCAPDDAIRFFDVYQADMIIPYHDASRHDDDFGVTISDVGRALAHVHHRTDWLSKAFPPMMDHAVFDRMVDEGDRSWIVPGKLLATSCPCSDASDALSLERLLPLLRADGVNTLISLNFDIHYDRKVCSSFGIRQVELPFEDGGNPPDHVTQRFFDIMRSPGSVVALHCKAGLGRTGTLAAMYLAVDHSFSAREAIAWCRLCRPGCVIGPQQHFLEEFVIRGFSDLRNPTPVLTRKRALAVQLSPRPARSGTPSRDVLRYPTPQRLRQ